MQKLIYTLCLFCGLASCSNETIKPSLRGELLGFVELIDVYGDEYYDLDSVKVTVGESDFYGVTDENGRFSIKDIEPGTYNIAFQYDGFGFKKIYSIPIIGGDVPYFFNNKITIYEQPKIETKFVSVSREDDIVNVEMVLDTFVYGECSVYWSDSMNVSTSSYIYQSSVNKSFYENSIFFSIDLQKVPYPLMSAENIYFIVTIKNSYETMSSYNQETEKEEYHSEVTILNPMKVE